MLTIQLLGTPRITLDGEELAIERRKSRALLYYLAASPRPVQREHLLAFFWPDSDRASAQQVLRTTLSGLRKALGSALQVERESVWVEEGTSVDARDFRQGLTPIPGDAQTLRSVLELYRGPFLQDFSLPDSPEFDHWQEVEREGLLRLATRGWMALSRIYETNLDLPNALVSLDRALALDPLQEDAQRESMRLAHLSGDRPGAIRRYDTLRRLLDEELGVPPMPETRSLYDDILNDRLKAAAPAPAANTPEVAVAAPARPERAELPFISRAAELEALRENAFANRLVLIEGEPGIGKTRLAEEFLRSQSGVLCLHGAGRELEQGLPYQPVIEALRSLQIQPAWQGLLEAVKQHLLPIWLQEVARLLPEVDPQGAARGSDADEWRLWEGLSQFLKALSAQVSALVFIDDLHWADPSTLGLLGYLVRHSSGANLGFLAAARSYTPRSPLANLTGALMRENRLVRVPLERFTPEAVYAIAQQLSPDDSQELGNWLLKSSEGNPFILTEMVRHARQKQLLQPGGHFDDSALTTGTVIPSSVYSLIQQRLSTLSEPARRILDMAVVAGRSFDFDLVARATGLSEEESLDGLDELVQANLVIPEGQARYHFNHSLTMEVAWREVGEARHRQLHRSIAAALESMYRRSRPAGLAGLLAFHYSEGRDPLRAAPFAFEAGLRAAELAAWFEAVAFFEQALAGSEGWARYPVLMALGAALTQAGQNARAAEVLREAVALGQAEGHPESVDAARLALARALLPAARFAESTRETRKVLESGLPENAAQAELWWGTALSIEGADLEAAAEHLNHALELSQQSGDLPVRATIEFELGSLWAQRGDLTKALEDYQRSLETAEQGDTPDLIERRVLAHNNLAYHMLLLGNPGASEHARAGMKLAQEKGLLWLQPYLYSTAGEIALAQGDTGLAEMNFTAGLELARQMSIPERIAGLTANLGLVAKQQGNQALAIHRLSSALAQADALGLRQLSAQVRVWLAPLLPKEEARAQLQEARAIAQDGGRMRLLEEIERVEKGI